MKYNSDIFREQFPLVKSFLYHITYYRLINKAIETSGLQSELWIRTLNAYLLQASILWCMIFGSDGCNPTHWKKLSVADSNDLQSSFRKSLHKRTGLSLDDWRDYWEKMLDFRNKYVAHRELNYNNPVPNFSTAIDVALFYDQWIREIIAPDVLIEPPLEGFVTRLRENTHPLIQKLLDTTIAFNKASGEYA